MTKVLPALGSNASDGQCDRRPPSGNRLSANLEAGPDERVAPLVGFSFRSPLPQGGPGVELHHT